jgi:hypothetical protein
MGPVVVERELNDSAVLHEDRSVDAGTHAELMGRCPHYADLYGLQAAMYG